MTMHIEESGMTFGPFEARDCFRLEASEIYAKLGQGVKMAEFVVLRTDRNNPRVVIVEAKTTCPKDANFEPFGQEIAAQLCNAAAVYFAVRLHRMPDPLSECPDRLMSVDLKSVPVRFVLVIKDHQDDWLSNVQPKLLKFLQPFMRIWGMKTDDFVVLNERMARDRRLIL